MDIDQIRKVYVTKLWETKGIYEVNVEDCGKNAVKEIGNEWNYFSNNQFWDKYEDAANHVKELRDKKIKTLLDKIERLNEIIL